MAYEPNKTYTGTIAKATATESSKGTAGIEFQLVNPDAGMIYHTEWVTAANVEKKKKLFTELGVDELALRLSNFWEAPGDFLEGKACSWTTKEETYDGKTRVRVEWLNGPGRAARPISRNSVATLISLFGGTVTDDEPKDAPWDGEGDEA